MAIKYAIQSVQSITEAIQFSHGNFHGRKRGRSSSDPFVAYFYFVFKVSYIVHPSGLGSRHKNPQEKVTHAEQAELWEGAGGGCVNVRPGPKYVEGRNLFCFNTRLAYKNGKSEVREQRANRE